MNPVKMFGNRPGFIGLQMADEVPDGVVIRDFLDFGKAFLDEVFAKIALSGRQGLKDRLDRFSLAHGQQAYRLDGTPRVQRCIGQQILNYSKVFRDSNHVLLALLRYTRQPQGPSYGKSGQLHPEEKTWQLMLLNYCHFR